MGFGSGGGFTPSPNNVPGSTQTGTDKDTDVHQFTGSVDITGSLPLMVPLLPAVAAAEVEQSPAIQTQQQQFNFCQWRLMVKQILHLTVAI